MLHICARPLRCPFYESGQCEGLNEWSGQQVQTLRFLVSTFCQRERSGGTFKHYMKKQFIETMRWKLLFIVLLASVGNAFAWNAVNTTIDGITYEATSSSGSTVIAVDPE